MEPKEANGLEFDHDVSEAHGDVLELAHRHSLGARPGTVRVLAFWNHARMGVYRDALAASPTSPDVTATRAPGREKYGFGLTSSRRSRRTWALSYAPAGTTGRPRRGPSRKSRGPSRWA